MFIAEQGTINSKINGTPKGGYLPISKQLLWASKFGTAKIKCSFKRGNQNHLGGTIYFAVDGTFTVLVAWLAGGAIGFIFMMN